jgi:hypothetical protein
MNGKAQVSRDDPNAVEFAKAEVRQAKERWYRERDPEPERWEYLDPEKYIQPETLKKRRQKQRRGAYGRRTQA